MAQNTPFSFHCMVCFEEFHPEDRYPVVLPCGHTYVCIACANRLDKCMECRTPLYTLVPVRNVSTVQGQNSTQLSNNGARSSWANARSSAKPLSDGTPPTPPQKKRLVLPKNVVLLSLIEATEQASEDARKKYGESPFGTQKSITMDGAASIPNLHTMGSIVDTADEEDEEEERIRICTSLAVGVAGTYAVAVKEGLEIYSTRPNNACSAAASTILDTRDEDVESLVRFYNAEQMEDGEGTPNSRKSRDPLRLCFGDRVQIVSFCEGWGKLARGYGYVRAESNQLVKVGGSVDRACKLEAMLCSLSDRRKELRIEQSKVDNQFIRYMNDLQHSLQNDEDLTVILADTFSPLPEIVELVEPEKDDQSASARRRDEEWDDKSFISKPTPLERPSTPPLQNNRVSRFACFSGGVFGDDENNANETSLDGRRWQSQETAVDLFPNASHPSPSAMRAGAQAWRERHGRPTAADAGIDFRTGMSGHMALLSSHANSHKYLDPSYRESKPNRMSSHTGLGMTIQSLTDILNSLTLPVIGSTPPRRSEREGIRQNGSM